MTCGACCGGKVALLVCGDPGYLTKMIHPRRWTHGLKLRNICFSEIHGVFTSGYPHGRGNLSRCLPAKKIALTFFEISRKTVVSLADKEFNLCHIHAKVGQCKFVALLLEAASLFDKPS